MKSLLMISLCLTLILFSSGCTQKEPEIIYVKQKKFDFQLISLEGAYIHLEPKEKEVCVPKLIELNTIYQGIKEAYDLQFSEYEKFYREFKEKK